MLFPSFAFLFVFLPVTLIGLQLIGRFAGDRACLAWLIGATLVFYGWSNPPHLAILVGSIVLNFAFGAWLLSSPSQRRAILALGITVDLAILGYFKYAGFLADTWGSFTDHPVSIAHIGLPLGISFFTFQQIGYLLDTSRGAQRDRDFIRYAQFVAFFPQLVAGPIVLARELIPQFSKPSWWRLDRTNVAVGVTLLGFGLAKKMLIADPLSQIVDPLFAASSSHLILNPVEAWAAALAYTLQIYFDFSGYSDMAIGVARILGILLPENFNSPYKATSITDFWNRWHLTLSRFLRERLYFSMTLRKGKPRASSMRRSVAVVLTMTLGGLWHGAGWTYVVWGALHGVLLAAHDAWRSVRPRLGRLPLEGTLWGRAIATSLTMISILVTMIVFRAESWESATSIGASFFGLRGLGLPTEFVSVSGASVWIAMGLAICLFAPNTQEMLRHYSPTFYRKSPPSDSRPALLDWHPTRVWALAIAALWVGSVLSLSRVASFVYFQF